jgi:WD40 repeat protein
MRVSLRALALFAWLGAGLTLCAAAPEPPLPAGARLRIGSTLFRHPFCVVIAWSPDGKMLASAGGGDSVSLWDAASGHELRRLHATNNAPTRLEFSPDGKLLAASCMSGDVLVWEAATAREPRLLKCHESEVRALSFSPDGGRLLTAALDVVPGVGLSSGRVRTWDVKTGARLSEHHILQPESIDCPRFCADGKSFFVGWQAPSGVVIQRWAETGPLVGKLALGGSVDPPPAVRSLAFAGPGRLIGVVGAGEAIRCWDLETDEELFRCGSAERALGELPRAAVTREGSLVALAETGEGTVSLWDATAGIELRRWNTGQPIRGLAWSPDGRLLATASAVGITVWDPTVGKRLLPTEGERLGPLWFTSDGRELLRIDVGGRVCRFDPATGRELGRFQAVTGTVGHFAVSADGRTIAVSASQSAKVEVRDALTGRLRTKCALDEQEVPRVVALSADGRTLAAAGLRTLICWDTSTGKERGSGRWQNARPVSLSFDPARGDLIVTRADCVHLFDPDSGEIVRTFAVEAGGIVRSVAPDGRSVCLTDGNVTRSHPAAGLGREWTDLTVRETLTGGRRLNLAGHDRHVTVTAFSADGQLLASGDFGGAIRLWDTVTGAVLAVWQGHRCWVAGLAFSPDGKSLASSGVDTTVLLWKVPPRPQRLAPEPEEWGDPWEELVSPDPERAWRAMNVLIREPDRGVPLLLGQLRKRSLPDLPRLLAELDDDEFDVRERATETLASLGLEARAILRTAVLPGCSLEQRRRVRDLLARETVTGLAPDLLRQLRAVEVLERIGTPSALEVLAEIARTSRGGDWTSADAVAARERLTGKGRP